MDPDSPGTARKTSSREQLAGADSGTARSSLLCAGRGAARKREQRREAAIGWNYRSLLSATNSSCRPITEHSYPFLFGKAVKMSALRRP